MAYYSQGVRSFRRSVAVSPPGDVDQDSSPLLPGPDFDGASAYSPGVDRTRYQPRRTSAISYQNAGARDRSHSRGPRNLVVVIPPPDFPLDQGHLGNVLSVGPRHRLSQGILLPLFPSMFGQLNAIAREYNFPSTVGLCLYLHINENGITMTPRISDDSWQYLFGHLFEGRPPATGQHLPIGGSIEFDIDLTKARWFDAWASGVLRERDPELHVPLSSRSFPGAHRHGEGHATSPDDLPLDDRWDTSGSTTLVSSLRAEALRHLPRKLSLVDRLELQNIHPLPKTPDHPDSLSPDHGLSPIPQSAVSPGRPAKTDLEHRVNSWRASTELFPVSMTEAYQHASDAETPAGVTTMDEYALDRSFSQKVKIDEYLWSLTTQGPRSPVMESPIASSRIASVHLDRRVNGTVPLSPTTITTWGPDDGERDSEHLSDSRLPSPDSGERVVDDIMVPRSRAVWGSSFGWRSATTWKAVYPYSAPQTKSASIRVQLQDPNGFLPQYPNLVIYPAMYASRSSHHSVWGSSFGWQGATSWRKVYPYSAQPVDPEPSHSSVWGSSFGWHREVTWRKVYPYSTVTRQPVHSESSRHSVWGNSFGWQREATWRKVYPYSTVMMQLVAPIQLRGAGGLLIKYPGICIYPAVYPSFEIYPVSATEEDVLQPVPVRLGGANDLMLYYPSLVIYPSLYPHFDIYPAVAHVEAKELNQSDKGIYGASNFYPNLVIYPAVYPHFELYPALFYSTMTAQPVSSKFSHNSVWGNSFGWQREATWRKVYPHSTMATQPVAPIQLRGAGGLLSKYPGICVYPTVYPSFEIYPASAIEEDVSQPVSVKLRGSNDLLLYYPSLVIYPSLYPHFDIYPEVARDVEAKKFIQSDKSIYGALYPSLVIYPSVYPYFNLYPATLQVAETFKQNEAVVRLVNAGNLTTEYPNMTIYPNVYPYLDIYPTRTLRKEASNTAWGVSFGWLSAKTWLQVYPLHNTKPSTSKRQIESKDSGIANAKDRKPAVWGSSFGWKSATTWRSVWPTSSAEVRSNPPHAADVATEEQKLNENQHTVDLIPHYPNLVIYPAVYPHIDVYPSFARSPISASVKSGKGQLNLRHRRIEMWRARTAAQVGLAELIANNHTWEVDEPFQLDLASYAWSRTSAGPPTPPLELSLTPSIPRSVHIDGRVQGSVLLTPSTATTWGPQDDDWYSDVLNIERLPSPDLGQRVEDDVENTRSSHRPWQLVWPPFCNTRQIPEKSVFTPEYPHLMIYAPAYPHFELYPAWASAPALEKEISETPANYVYPVLNIYPSVYPHFDIYPSIAVRLEDLNKVDSNVQHERVETRLPSSYPNFNIYPACYPYNLDHIYPPINVFEPTRVSVVASCGYPWLVVYHPVYPFIIPYPTVSVEIHPPSKLDQLSSLLSSEGGTISVKLSAQYPILDPYPAGYPWSLESIYPALSVDSYDYSGEVKLQYPYLLIYPAVYPFVQPYPRLYDSLHIPGPLDESEYESARAFLSSEIEHVNPAYPSLELHLASPQQDEPGLLSTQVDTKPRRGRKTHQELHDSVFGSLEKRAARNSKTHLQLHIEVFRDGVVWTPTGYLQDLASLTAKKWEDSPVQGSSLGPSRENLISSPLLSQAGTLTGQSPGKVDFPIRQPPALPPIRVRSPEIPSQPSAAVSETQVPRILSPHTHMKAGSRFAQAVKSIVRRRSHTNSAPPSPNTEVHKERSKDQPSPMRFLADRRAPGVPPLPLPPQAGTSEFLSRVPRSSLTKDTRDNLVLQRARAYEQVTGTHPSPDTTTRTNETSRSLPALPPLPPLSFMGDLTEAIDQSRYNFA